MVTEPGREVWQGLEKNCGISRARCDVVPKNCRLVITPPSTRAHRPHTRAVRPRTKARLRDERLSTEREVQRAARTREGTRGS
jgi:hypothetical protein